MLGLWRGDRWEAEWTLQRYDCVYQTCVQEFYSSAGHLHSCHAAAWMRAATAKRTRHPKVGSAAVEGVQEDQRRHISWQLNCFETSWVHRSPPSV